MKSNPIPVLACLLLLSLSSAAQNDNRYNLMLKSGAFIPEKNITAEKLNQFNSQAFRTAGKSFAIMQFEHIPNKEEQGQLQKAGIDLLDYIPNNAYSVIIHASLDSTILTQLKVRAIVNMTPEQKMQPELANGNYPSRAVKVAGTIDVWISFPKSFTYEEVSTELHNHNFDLISTLYKDYRVAGLRIATQRLQELASLSCIEYVETAPGEDQPLNNKVKANARANILSSSAVGGYGLRGSGVVIGVGDNANPLTHVDFSGRIINRAAIPFGAHGVHVIGIAGGAGIKEELFAGMAPKATIVAQSFSNILAYAPAYVQDYGMVITNNSYGNIDECSYNGLYDLYSRILDQQSFQMPNLQNVFAAGNSGGSTCSPYPTGFQTVYGGYQSAKNVITVGNAWEQGAVLDNVSSKGPARDGRIKPEVAAQGTLVVSTWPGDIYSFNTGTSMSSPAVAGGLGLLYERYRLLHSGANPKSALMKALLCNGATDINNPGPDYASGFGWINLLRSVKMMEQNTYINDSVANSVTKTHLITVPANTGQLKVMLYWNDPAATVLATPALVNDLDLEVVDPSVTTNFPFKLDPSNPNANATTGADHINNIEQVVINNPAAGTYSVRVKGTAVTQNPNQEYFLVYDTIPVSTTLTYPFGGEHFKQNDSIYISWDSYGDSVNTFNIEYSVNNGGSWNTINANAAANLRMYKWFMPNSITNDALVRITRNGSGLISTSGKFTILGVDTVTLDATQCEGYISIDWTTVTGATDYEVMMLQGDEMVPVATTTATNYSIGGLSKDSVYWITVRARLNGIPGRRATAISRQPNTGNCAGTISDNDIKADAIVSPLSSGRKYTQTELPASIPLTVRIKNLDDAASTSALTFSYSINGGTTVTDPPVSPTISAGGTYNYTFLVPLDLSAVGTYSIQVNVNKAGDPVVTNNTMTQVFKQLDNQPITLVTPFLDNMETGAVQSFTTNQVGLPGLDRYDFVNSSVYGRIRTFINTGIAYSGSKALTLDADRYNAGNTDSLTGTFNLTGFNSNTDDIRLDFHYKNHGQDVNAANKVWIRGSDADNWIQAYDLAANQNEVDGSYKFTPSIEVSDLLFNAVPSQSFSSSFQVRWGQWGQILAADNDGGAGYTFDDIKLYKTIDDIQMISIDTPIVSSCALSAVTPVKVSVRNSANTTTVNPIPVAYRIDGGSWVFENIPPIAGNATVQYTFTSTADLSAAGNHLVEVKVVYPTDTYAANDTLSVSLVNSPVISSFPYLQDFESSNGSWYTNGKFDSWEYGTPASPKINRAASGSKAWKTRVTGNYNDLEKSYLYSPCFNISGLTTPTLSLSLALDLEDCGAGGLCDGAYMEYSADGKIWTRLGATGQGTNWYNRGYSGNNLWSVQDYTRWHVATIPLPTGLTQLRLRFVVTSDPAVNREGIAIDDIHIYDNINGIYDGVTMGTPVTQNITGGSNWVDFTSGGKLIASVQPNNLNMGSTDVQAYINTAAVRNHNNQYYHDRNITIKPANNILSDSTTVRFYFLDTETEALINATGCGSCYKPSMAYELGVSKYSDLNKSLEDGIVDNGVSGIWLFINAAKAKKVPFDKGYYAEFKVKNFSEFWLNNGGFDNNQTLPLQLLDFTAKKKSNKDVLVEWKTAAEFNVNRFEIEIAKGNTAWQQNQFIKIGTVSSNGNSTGQKAYQFTDIDNNKSGVRYYRLKMIDNDGSFTYSAIRPVVFGDEVSWQVYPNPSSGIFNLSYQLSDAEIMTVKVYDVNGKVVKQYHTPGNGFVQKLNIDLSNPGFATGLYMIEANAGEKKQTFKLMKR